MPKTPALLKHFAVIIFSRPCAHIWFDIMIYLMSNWMLWKKKGKTSDPSPFLRRLVKMGAKWRHLLGFDAIEATHQLAQVRPQFLSLYTPIFQAPLWLLDLWACLWVSRFVRLKEYRLDRVTRLSLKKTLKIIRHGISFNLCCLLIVKENINSRGYIDKSYPIFTEMVKRKVKHNWPMNTKNHLLLQTDFWCRNRQGNHLFTHIWPLISTSSIFSKMFSLHLFFYVWGKLIQ